MITHSKDFLKKNYIYLNITLLILCVYVILFPFLSKILEFISPNLVQCPYLTITHKPCPLCGGTRYLQNIGTAFSDITYLFNFFGILVLCVIFEFIFRTVTIIRIRQKKDMKRTILFDLLYHGLFLIFFFSYEILYLLYQ